MKTMLIASILLVTLFFCNEPNVQTQLSKDTSISQTPAKVIVDTGNISVNTKLPFGDTILAKLKYPVLWEADPENYGHLKNPGNKAFEKISAYYSNMKSRNTIGLPKFGSITYLSINEHQKKDHYFDTVVAKQIDSCIYRLPNMGAFQCYYFREYSKKNSGGQYGNLLLINNKTKAGKIITIYFEYGGEQNITMRYFLIDQDLIHIYEGSYYDDGLRLRKSHQIQLERSGEIFVANQKY